jgi:hypothetical protein
MGQLPTGQGRSRAAAWRPLAPDPKELYVQLKRVKVEHLVDPVADEAIAARFVEQPQMLCIVNSRAHARGRQFAGWWIASMC